MIKNRRTDTEKEEFPGYPVYPAEEDIYNNYEEIDVEPDTKQPVKNEKYGKLNERDFNDDESGIDLDIPGAELDDEQEMIGSEDEENNYYSLGGDNHEGQEEHLGD